MIRVLGIELRRSVFRFAAPVLAVGNVAIMVTEQDSWRGVWPMASAAVGAQGLFIGPLLAGVAAWEAARRVRNLPNASDNGSRPLFGVMLAAQVIWAMLIPLAGAGCAIVVNLLNSAPQGFLSAPYLVLCVAFIVESAALGHLCGRVLNPPVWFGQVVALLAVFLRVVLFIGAPVGSSRGAFNRVPLSGRPYTTVDSVAMACAVAEALLVVLAAVIVPWAINRLRGWRHQMDRPLGRLGWLSAGLAATLGIGCLVAVFVSPPLTRDRQYEGQALCTDTAMKLCIWPENAVYLPTLGRFAQRAEGVAKSLDGELPSQLDEFGINWERNNFLLINSSTWFLSDTVASVIAWSLAPMDCPTENAENSPDSEAYYAAVEEVAAMIQLMLQDSIRPKGVGDSSGTDRNTVEQIWSKGPDSQRLWIDQRVEVMRHSAKRACN